MATDTTPNVISPFGSTVPNSPAGNRTAGGNNAAASANGGGASPLVTPALTLTDIPGTGDIQVLNLALALEDLEADLYVQALYRLTNGGTNALGVVIDGLGLDENAEDVEYLAVFGQVEAEHRDLLRSTLGGAAISPFRYDFGFQNASRAQVIGAIYRAEAAGVGAYLGAVPLLDLNGPYLPIAAAILGTEARHTAVVAAIRSRVFNQITPTAPPETRNSAIDQPITPNAVLAAVSPFIVP